MGHRIAEAFPEPDGDGTFRPEIASYALAVSLATIIMDTMQRPFRDAFAAVILAVPPSEWCEFVEAPDGSVFIGVPVFDPDNVPPTVRARLRGARRSHTSSGRRSRGVRYVSRRRGGRS